MTDATDPTDESVPPSHNDRPSIAERAAKRDQLHAGGRDRYTALLRSLQAGRELPIHREGGRITFDWNPILWTLLRVALVLVVLYFGARTGLQWWRENHADTWSGPDATVRSGVRLADCPLVDAIRVDEFPSWIAYQADVYRYAGWKRPYIGPDTPGYSSSGYSIGSMHLVLIENTPDGKARDAILVWLEGALAGIEYARTPDCAVPEAVRSQGPSGRAGTALGRPAADIPAARP